MTPQPNDRIVFERADGLFDIHGVDADGRRIVIRDAGFDLKTARDTARHTAGMNGGRLLFSHHSNPDTITLYDSPAD